MITICAEGDGAKKWSIGTLTNNNAFDLHGILVHEFGHSRGLGELNSNSSNVGVMGNTPGLLRKRHLYPWDIECQERQYGRRKRPIIFREQPHNSILFRPEKYIVADGYVRGMGNFAAIGLFNYYAIVAYKTSFKNSVGDALSSSPRFYNQQYSSGFTNTYFRELPSLWRTIYNFDYQSSNRFQNVNSVESAYQYSYSMDFSTLHSKGEISFCTKSSPLCLSQKISTYHPISVAHDEATTNRTIYAWVHANRKNSNSDHNIYIAVGQRGTDDLTLNIPIDTGIKTSTNISIACGPLDSAKAGYDCILAYVPLSSTTYSLEIRHFRISGKTDNSYLVTIDPTVTKVGWLTASSPTVWYNDIWYLAHHSGTGIQIRKSDWSRSWSHSQTLEESVGTPRSISFGKENDRTIRLYFTAP